MPLVLANNGEQITLEQLVGKATSPEPLKLRLFTNNYTPVKGSTAANFTEASGNGYASINIAGSSWTYTAGSPSDITASQQTFTFTGALGNVYGYYLTRQTTGDIVWAEAFSGGPVNVLNNGDQIKITPKITLT